MSVNEDDAGPSSPYDETNISGVGEDFDDWEEVDTTTFQRELLIPGASGPQHGAGNIEITLTALPKKKSQDKSAKAAQLHAERLIRIDCHKIHTVCLLVSARIRNQWINDPLLHARLLSLTPITLQDAFAGIHKSRVPDANKRGRLFESALARLVTWWSDAFFYVTPTGHMRSRTFEEVQEEIKDLSFEQVIDTITGIDAEIVRSPKSLMKRALMREGSRDVSAQLFTALCRALDIPARLVVSLQSVPWQAKAGKPKSASKSKQRGKARKQEMVIEGEDREDDEDEDMEEVVISGEGNVKDKGKGKARQPPSSPSSQQNPLSEKAKGKQKENASPIIRLRKTKSKGQRLGSSSTARSQSETPTDPTTTAPVFWTEVFSRADARWIPVDPIRHIVNKRKVFDPTPAPLSAVALPAIYTALNPSLSSSGTATPRMPQSRVENRMLYVLAFEEDGHARDVTARYAREYGAKVAKVQGGASGRANGGRTLWWEHVLSLIQRPYRLHRDDLEDEELHSNQITEPMPTTLVGFKDHPLYVLERHLKRDEALDPPGQSDVGKFRGEPVYARSAVVRLKSAETWMRQGRVVKEGEQPLKFVKMRAGTVRGLRAMQALREAGVGETGQGGETGEVAQGLYARRQTELYIPPPIVDGKIPKNDFGNIDLYVPSMLPAGGVHIPFKGVAKLARRLGFAYAEAVTGFEFRKRRALPVLEGVVVAAENEASLVEAYWQDQQHTEAKLRAKKREHVLRHWSRLIQGLRIRERLQQQYAQKPEGVQLQSKIEDKDAANIEIPDAGGYVVSADDVVQAYKMPKYIHNVPPLESNMSPVPSRRLDEHIATDINADNQIGESSRYSLTAVMDAVDGIEEDEDEMEEVLPVPSPVRIGAPITMRELAEGAARKHDLLEGSLNPTERDSQFETPSAVSREIFVIPPGAAHSKNGHGSASNVSIPSQTHIEKRTNTITPNGRTSRKKRPGRESESSAHEGRNDDGSAKRKKISTPIPASTRVLRPRKAKNTVLQEDNSEEV